MDDDTTLLRQFVEEGSGEAFTTIVQRHLPLVYSVALRRVGGDAQLALDVAQVVFLDFARKAPRLLELRSVAGWLFTATQFAAAKVVRAERRRKKYEQEAHTMRGLTQDAAHDAEWAAIRPVLDDAMMRLKPAEREAVVLRFFNGRGFGDIGAAAGLSESGARMRVERALEKLREELQRRGVSSTMAALGTVLTTHAVAAPPAGMAASVATAALSGTAATGGAATFLGFLAMTKVQVGVTAGIVLTGATMIGVQEREQAALRREIAAVEPRQPAMASLQVGRPQTSPALTEFTARRDAVRAETAALRAEVRSLTTQWEETRAQRRAQESTRTAGSGVDLKTYELSELDQKPVPLARATPVYPEAFKRANLPGHVTVEILIDEKGEVVEVKVLEATHPQFAVPAMEAVLGWKFEPGMKDRQPVATRVKQAIEFASKPESNWF